jgi:hypothetical protein
MASMVLDFWLCSSCIAMQYGARGENGREEKRLELEEETNEPEELESGDKCDGFSAFSSTPSRTNGAFSPFSWHAYQGRK